MNEMIKAERNKICSRKQTRMLFLAGVVLIVAYFFFFQFNYQNVFYVLLVIILYFLYTSITFS